MDTTEKKAPERPTECPSCGSSSVARIIYGYYDITSELESRLDAGEVVLGGCCITGDDPMWRCLDCRVEVHGDGRIVPPESIHRSSFRGHPGSSGIVLTPTRGPADWKALLADPETQWVPGYSAWAVAHSWEAAPGFPRRVAAALATSDVTGLQDAQPLLVIPEHKVSLPGGRRASQNDVWVLARSAATGELVSIAVEGKVSERFGSESLAEWLEGASPGKIERLAFLKQQLGLKGELTGDTRYQLLHRAASAVIEANRFNADHALMLVHSFSQKDEWFDDYVRFCELFGVSAKLGSVQSSEEVGGVRLHFGWVRGDPRYLSEGLPN